MDAPPPTSGTSPPTGDIDGAALPGRILVVSTPGDNVQEDMIAPLVAQRRWLRQRGATLVRRREEDFDAIPRLVAAERCDTLLLATSWRRGADETIELCRRLRALPSAPRLVYLDSFDGSSSPYFGILPHVDVYAKKQLLREVRGYDEALAGGYVFTDHLQNQRGWDLDGWQFGSTVPPGHHDRLRLAWNLGAAPHLQRMLRRGAVRPRRPLRARPIDVFCRVAIRSLDGRDWYSRHRLEGLAAIERLGASRTVVSHGGRPGHGELVRPRRYRREMSRSRIAFSPFGWGELCYRDFEAACLGCLLVKPSVEHLRTSPDLFRPHETYVPVRWDLADLEDVCLRYLDDLDAAQRIVDAARATYADFFRRHATRRLIEGLLSRPSDTPSVATAMA